MEEIFWTILQMMASNEVLTATVMGAAVVSSVLPDRIEDKGFWGEAYEKAMKVVNFTAINLGKAKNKRMPRKSEKNKR